MPHPGATDPYKLQQIAVLKSRYKWKLANQKWKDVLQHRGLPLHDNSTDTNSSSPLHSPAANRTPVHPWPNGHANDASVGRQRGSRTSLVQQQSRQKFFHIPHR